MEKFWLILIIIISMAAGAVLVSTTTADQLTADQSKPLKIWSQNENGSITTYKVVDEATGVNYVVVKVGTYGGVSITPRLNSDGTLYTENQ